MHSECLTLTGMETDSLSMENSVQCYKKLKIQLPHDSAAPLLGICPQSTTKLKDTCKLTFIYNRQDLETFKWSPSDIEGDK